MRPSGHPWEDRMRTLVCALAVSATVSCGSVAGEPLGSGGYFDGSGGAGQCAKDELCRPYCGSVPLSTRCEDAFGTTYGIVSECDSPPGLCCVSLSDFSPGLISDCDNDGRQVFCCAGTNDGSGGASQTSSGTGGLCPPVVAPECDCCHLSDGTPCCNGQFCSGGICR